MSKAEAVAAILTLGITAYAVFGGADFGAGMWDLLAPAEDEDAGNLGKRVRDQIDHSIAPVWEANHVWLIFVLVVAWTAFPPAFSAVMTTLYIPLALAALGIVLRGSGFAFRHALPGPLRAPATRVFGVSSVLTPFFLGAALGGIASGRVPPGNAAGDIWTSWANPSGAMVGALAVAASAYLAAIYLVADARRLGDAGLERYFRLRGVAAGVVAGALALAGVLVLRDDSPYVYDRLVHEALPLVLISAACGLAALTLLAAGHPRGTRLLGAGAVATVVWGWGVAQWPYLLPETLTVDGAAGDSTTLIWVVVVFCIAAVVVLPSLALLFWLDQRSRLEEEGA
ncbi:MAG TPA: cytochrome d ubiquinol oxidase subunit II [Methylomirabilota bacterium]|nr:cytochrome d ubiquinol oxidase subunit II [Methylomirabilota bacterium]